MRSLRISAAVALGLGLSIQARMVTDLLGFLGAFADVSR